MPTYTYACTACDEVIEKRQSFSDTPLTICESCGGSLRKVIHPVGIVFKGSGWYVTDSRNGSATGSSTRESEKSEKTETKSESTTDSASAKSESAGEAKPTASQSASSAKESSSAPKETATTTV